MPDGIGFEGTYTLEWIFHRLSKVHSVWFVEAATIPLVTLTAALTLFRRQKLPSPWSLTNTSTSLIIYGASSSLGSYIIKLASLSNIHPIIAICGSSNKDYVGSLLDFSKGDKIVDYKQGVEGWLEEVNMIIKEGGVSPLHAVDAISNSETWQPLARLLSDHTTSPERRPILSVFSGRESYSTPNYSSKIDIIYTYVGTSYSGAYLPSMPNQPPEAELDYVRKDVDFAYILLRYIARMLAQRRYSGHPYEVIPGGLEGVQKGLNLLKSGKGGGKKFVYRIGETKGFNIGYG